MRVYIDTLGCRLNEAESESWARQLRDAGQQVVVDPAQADICVLNSCAVTAEAGRKSRQRLRRLHRYNPQACLVAAGCYATMAPETVAALPGVALVLDNQQKTQLVPTVLRRWASLARPITVADAPATATARTRAFLKVQDGCNNHCTYCIVRELRGRERSIPVPEVVHAVRQLRAAGYQEVVLTGVHLGAYGHDRGQTLYDLVAAILAETNLPRLRLSSLEPWDLPPHFFDLWGESQKRLLPHLHLPLQSGCDGTLRRMGRHTTRRDFATLLAAARGAIPDLTVTTDIIVGFPGETDADFAASLAFVRQMAFGHVHIFPYSQREGTPASLLPDQVAPAVKKARVRAMQKVAAAGRADHLAQFVGQVRAVLWEQEERTVPGYHRWQGLTDNYLRVEMELPAPMALHNRILPTYLQASDGAKLIGALTSPALTQRGKERELWAARER